MTDDEIQLLTPETAPAAVVARAIEAIGQASGARQHALDDAE
jgi:hypothetical protein